MCKGTCLRNVSFADSVLIIEKKSVFSQLNDIY